METGQSIGRYRLQEKIGKGGMAEIFKAYESIDDDVQRTVAIKRLFPKLSADREFVGMFVNEALIASNMDHPNIIRTYDLLNIGSYYYIVMEYIQGVDLEELVILEAPGETILTISEIAFVIHEVAMGLAYAHESRGGENKSGPVVHRDISPGNILIGCNGEVKITDFGIARATQYASFTRPGVLKGKYEYMAPEYVKGKEFDGRADLFSLGVVLYEMLTGQNPFMGVTPQDIWNRILKHKPPPPSQLVPSVPATMDQIVLRALSKNPAKRYHNGEELAAVLLPFFSDQGKKNVSMSLGLRAKKSMSGGSSASATQSDLSEFLPPDDSGDDFTREIYLDELLDLVDPVDVPAPLLPRQGAEVVTAPKITSIKPVKLTKRRKIWPILGLLGVLLVVGLTFLLWPSPKGLLSVNSDLRAEIYVDNNRMGLAPLSEMPIEAGFHLIEARRPGRNQSKSYRKEIKEDEHVKLGFTWQIKKPKYKKKYRKRRKISKHTGKKKSVKRSSYKKKKTSSTKKKKTVSAKKKRKKKKSVSKKPTKKKKRKKKKRKSR